MRPITLFFIGFLFMGYALRAQTFSRGEYFIDTDPGVGNATPFNMPGSGDAVDANLNIPVGALSSGFHVIGIRLLEPNGHWGPYELRSFLVSDVQPEAAQVTAAEYFIDTDPGQGKASPLTVGVAGNEVTFDAQIPTTGLSLGFHLIGVRLKDASGRWGPYELRTFLVNEAQGDAANITAAEYFIDTDPGQGKASPLTVGVAANEVTFDAQIPTTGLSLGFHLLGVRLKDASGKWGPYELRTFLVNEFQGDAGNITAAEYWIDTDPGQGKGTSLPVGPPGSQVDFVAAIPVQGLSEGMHLLGLRTRDANGKWGVYETRLFYIEPTVPVNTPITRVEYFLDQDPGAGKGFTTVYPPAADNNLTAVALRIPRCASQGPHKMGVRLIDDAGRVSHYQLDDINVSGTANATNNFTLKDGNWNSAAIWSTCEVPTSTVNATVRHTVNVDVDANCRTLRVERPARLEVEPGKKVTVVQ